ncbi:UxaA family hydrolase [Xanthobacter sp. KR7-225]|uniref:UxaA family hydrolase n=1 Tax=Xanthobacter sp. KR7-225 TaxID=3156613 RepID=UPI0032B5A1C5
MEEPDFLVHHKGDTLGVVVVEGVKAGQTLRGWVMDADETIEVKVLVDIPLGHKIALAAIGDGQNVIEYGNNVGKAVEVIPVGGYVHFHNIKSNRW